MNKIRLMFIFWSSAALSDSGECWKSSVTTLQQLPTSDTHELALHTREDNPDI